MRGAAWLVAAAGSCVLVACSFTSDLDSLDDQSCGSDTKACDNACRSVNDPAYGCGLGGCSPCFVSNGVANCSARLGTCAIASCNPGFADCVNGYADGCETNIAGDMNNCGQCGMVCSQSVPNGKPGCAASRCVVGSCNDGWADCDGIASNGCETPCAAHQSCTPDAGGFTCQ